MKQLFKNYNKILEKIKGLIGKNFDSKPFYSNDDNKYIKTKLKTFKDSIITNFHNKKVPEEKVLYKCLSIIILDSVIKSNNKYYPQTYLDECITNKENNNSNNNKNNNKRIILLKNQNQIVTPMINENQVVPPMMNQFRKK